VDIILGCNGLIWVSPTRPEVEGAISASAAVEVDEGDDASTSNQCTIMSRQQVEVAAR
jgi:exosome complex RNA-binding protein Rrp4